MVLISSFVRVVDLSMLISLFSTWYYLLLQLIASYFSAAALLCAPVSMNDTVRPTRHLQHHGWGEVVHDHQTAPANKRRCRTYMEPFEGCLVQN